MTLSTIVFPFSGFDIGGSHVATFELATELRRRHGRRCVFLVAKESPIAAEAERLGMEVCDTGELEATSWGIRKRRSPLYVLRRLPARTRVMRRFGRSCIVHCNDLHGVQSFGLITKAMGGKIIYHHHALNRMILPNRVLIGLADAVFAVSDICRRALSFIAPDRLSIVLNPIEVGDVDRPAARARICAKLGVDPARTLAGFVGNFWERKRPLFFLQAAAILAAQKPDLHFILFGRKADYEVDELEREAERLGLTGRVTFAGFMMPAEDNIAALDILLAPAVNEPFGRTPIEAALAGVPYVITDDAGHAEIGRRWAGGRLVPIDATPEAFAREALAVINDPGSVVLAEEARQAVARDFSINAHAETVEATYRRLEGRSGQA